MPKLLLPIAAGLALAGATAGGATYLLTSGESVEEVPPSVQATATPAPTATGTPEVSPTAAPTRTPQPSASPVPDDWKTYTDAELGFSLGYPPDLVAKDLTGPAPTGGLQERTIEFRSQEDRSRALSISVIESGLAGLTIEEWAVEFAACKPETIQKAVLDSLPAITCTREATGGRPSAAILSVHSGKIFVISATPNLRESEFSPSVESFGF